MSLLGFYRGCNFYSYKNEKYEKNLFLYTNKIAYGFLGFLVYIFPISIPLILYKEIYRIEVNIRNLEKTDYYFELL